VLQKVLPEVSIILKLHDQCVVHWHKNSSLSHTYEGIYGLIADEHAANFAIWHLEDIARIPDAPEADIARAKRQIDVLNQRRNDLIEAIDQNLYNLLEEQCLLNPKAELHSETPGLIIDRLSVLALKMYHTREEIQRSDAPPGHAERNRRRYEILEQQRNDLADCLNNLWHEILDGHKRFKVYRQLKMYNDPTLNPEIYRRAQRATG